MLRKIVKTLNLLCRTALPLLLCAPAVAQAQEIAQPAGEAREVNFSADALTYDSDAGFKITSAILQGYEHTNRPKLVSLISKTPQAWRIESIEEYEGKQEPVTDIFVIEGDYLTVTDGQRSETYRKCH